MGQIYKDFNSSSVSYSVDNIDFKYYGCNDSVGDSLKVKVKDIPSSFNPLQEKVWKHASKLLAVDNKTVKYESQAHAIEELTVK